MKWGKSFQEIVPGYATAVVEVGLDRIGKNYERMTRRIAPTILAPVVKADCYSLGANQVAGYLHKEYKVSQFYVAYAHEGEALRMSGALPIQESVIYVLNGCMEGTEDLLVQQQMTPVLSDHGQVARWANQARKLKRKLSAALHLDTGMARTGYEIRNASLAAEETRKHAEVIEINHVMTHLASADEPELPQTREQLDSFSAAADRFFPGLQRSFANSYGLIMGSEYNMDQSRTGLALYGLAFEDPTMDVAARLAARVVDRREVAPGQPVGYNATYRAPGPRKLATLGIGHADGIFQRASNRGHVIFRGIDGKGSHRAPIVGTISMDFMVVDVTNIPPHLSELGSWATFFDDFDSAKEWATSCDISRYQMLTHLHFHRMFRVHSVQSLSSPCE